MQSGWNCPSCSVRSDRKGIRAACFIIEELRRHGHRPSVIVGYSAGQFSG